MENLFSIGEVARYQNISKQTLIFYDKIGLFRPAWVDPSNGYRYYSASQIDDLDTILIMKKIGFSLEEIRSHMEHYDLDSSLKVLYQQLEVIDEKIQELRMIRSRVRNRCGQMEAARAHCRPDQAIELEEAGEEYLFCLPVEPPFTLREISIATKQCFAASFREKLPVFFQCGVVVPLERIEATVHRGRPGLSPHRKDRPDRTHPAAAGGAAGLHLPCGGLSLHRPVLPPPAGVLPGERAADCVGFLRVLHQRLYHHPRQKRIHHQNRLLCGGGRIKRPRRVTKPGGVLCGMDSGGF